RGRDAGETRCLSLHDALPISVRRSGARRLVERTELALTPGGQDILAGEVVVTAALAGGGEETARLRIPPGHPAAPASEDELAAKDRKSTRLNSSHVKISYAVF